MRRGASDNPWSNPRPENWVNHGQRFSRVNPRPNFHGYSQRPPGPRHWRPEGGFRPRNSSWNGANFKTSVFRLPPNDGHPPLRSSCPPPPRFSWPDGNQHNVHPSMQNSSSSSQFAQRDSYGLIGEQNLHETINAIKQKLRERTKSSDCVTEPVHDAQMEDSSSYKPTERRRIEHSRTSKPTTVKKPEKRGEGYSSGHKTNKQSHSFSDICKRKTEAMRRKILKQLFKLDKDRLRNLLNQSETSTKYEFALNSLFKETRDSISRDIRNAAEKSLQDNTKRVGAEREQVVQDEFLGHLGTMLDKDATLELSSMEPQIIAQLSKVLQQDLMGPLNDEMSVMSLANAMSDSVQDELFINDYQFHGGVDTNTFHPEYQYDLSRYHNYQNMEGDVKNENFKRSGENDYYFDAYNSDQYGDHKYNPESNSYNNEFNSRNDYSNYHQRESSRERNAANSPHFTSDFHQSQDDYVHPSDNQYSYKNIINQTTNITARDSPSLSYRLDLPNTEQSKEKLSPRRRKQSVNEKPINAENNSDNKNNDLLDETKNTEPVLPIVDEDFRSLLPKNINLNEIFLPGEVKDAPNSSIIIEETKHTPEDSISVSDVGHSSKRKCSETNEFEQSSKKPNISDSNIAIRKDLFPDLPSNKTCQVSPAKAEIIEDNTVKKLATVSCQTDDSKNSRKPTKAQGTQYYMKKSDASSQIYESLFSSKSKGTQTLGENMKDRSCQTLKIDGFATLTLSSNRSLLIDMETQTDSVNLFEKAQFIDAETSCNLIDETKFVKNVDTTSVKSENVLERMKEIDNQILELMKEKLSLYDCLKSTGSDIVVETGRRIELANNTYHIPIIRNKFKSGSETSRRSDKHSSSSSKHTDTGSRHVRGKERAHTREDASRSGKTMSNSNTPTKQKPSGLSESGRTQRTSSNQFSRSHRQKVKDEDHPKHDRHKIATSTRRPKMSSKTSDISGKILPYNLVQGKDINNCARPDSVVSVSPEEQMVEVSNIDNSVESRYIDPSGCPVPMDCEVVVSEEVVIKSENDNSTVISEDVNSTLSSNESRRRRTETRKNRSSSNSSSHNINSNNSNKGVKSDCDMVVVRNNAKLPHGGKTVPSIKIKKRTSASISEPQAKASPLYNLISQMKESDEETDSDIRRHSINQKIKINDSLPDDIVDANHNLSESQNSSQLSNVKIVDCIVQLERLDVTKIPTNLKLNNDINSLSDFNNPNMSFVEELDPAILNDDTLFSSKNYENDEDCLLQSEQFGSFCDTDPGIIENIEVDDAFNIIDQWDSKLFENVSLLEDREILQDKNLLDSLASTNNEGDRIMEEDDVPLKEPRYFNSHKEPIIALKCVGNNLLAASQDGNVYYYDGIHSKLLRTIKVCDAPVTCLTLRGKRPHFYSGSHDGILRCFNYENGEKVLEDVAIMCGAIQCMYQEWKTIYIGTQMGFVVQFDVVASTLLSDSTIKFSENAILALHAMKEGPRKVLLIASRSQEVTVKDAATGLLLRSFHGHNNTVYSLLFDSGKVYCGTSGPDVQIFDFVTGDIVGVHTGGRGAVCLQVYRGLIFTGCYDGLIYVYSKAGKEKPVAKIQGPGKMLLAMSVVRNKIIAGCKDKKLLSIIPLPEEVIKLLDP